MKQVISDMLFTEIHIKLFLAFLLGGILGVERQRHGRAAGLRTHILVCLASTALVSISTVISLQWPVSENVRIDPTRLAAGIMTGMGFICAGTIIRSRTYIRGLTTSASVWLTAALGIIIGLGVYDLALKTAMLSFLVLIGLNKIDNLIWTEKFVVLTISVSPADDLLEELKAVCLVKGAKIVDVHFSRNKKTANTIYKIHLKFSREVNGENLTQKLLNFPSVQKVNWKSY